MRPPPERNDVNRPAADEKITSKKELSPLTHPFGLDDAAEKWWAEHAPEVDRGGRTFATDDDELQARLYKTQWRLQRVRRDYLINNGYLAGEALSQALKEQAWHKQEDRRQELLAQEAREDGWYR